MVDRRLRVIWQKGRTMQRRKSIIFASVALSVGTIAGVVGVNAAAATAASTSHTLNFIAVATSTSPTTKTGHYFESDVDVANSSTIANDVLSCVTGKSSVACWVALSNDNGMLYGHFVISFSTGNLTGKITSGSGSYKNATGTISGKSVAAGEGVTIVYT
jgi:hypothetical protein